MQNDNRRHDNRITHILTAVLITVFFFAMIALNGVPMYNDSDQYISMHVRREPVYPVFLFIIRSIFADKWLMAAGVIQTVIVIASSYRFIRYFTDCFDLNPLCEWLVCGFVLLPYILTPLFSVMHVTMSCAIMSESIAIPLFLLFFVHMHRGVAKATGPDMIAGFVYALVLSLIRSNLMVLLIAWIIAALYVYIREKKGIRIVICILLFICAFPVRDVATKGYNLAFNGRFVGNQYANVTVLANIFYATDRETGDSIADPELKEIFDTLYDVMEDNGWSYKNAGNSPFARAVLLEEVHDRIKFEVIEYGLRDIIEARGIHDYLDYNAIAEEYAGEYIRILFPKCLSGWIPDWLIMGARGVARSIAVCHPAAYVYVVFILILSLICAVMTLRRESRSPGALAVLLSILLILGNAFGTAALIMCLSRYMIYGFPVFYTSLLCVATEIYNRRKNVVI